jgi:rare lipoprotein A
MKAILRLVSALPALTLILAALLAGCASDPPMSPTSPSPPSSTGRAPDVPPPSSGRGGYYLDDGPEDSPPKDLDKIADATPKHEPLHRYANRPYTVMGRDYVPAKQREPFRERGVASWYGKRFHGQKTSSGEPYDMYAMSAAHPTLPIPSYVRVVNLENGRSVVVRVNDRGPFLHKRIIDLSYAAAHRLDYIKTGKTNVEIEVVLPPAGADANALSESPGPLRVVRTTADIPNHYLQLGAFSKQSNAEELKTRVAARASEYADKLEIARVEGLYRVQLGPYGNRADASAAGERLRELLDLQPHLITR